MRRLLLTVFLLVGAAAGATEIYRWVDSDGVVHFSDRPTEGAERMELQEPQIISPPAVRTRRSNSGEEGESADTDRYRTLEIVSPGQEEVLWNIEGQLDVSMRLQPRLQAGDRVSLFLDDQEVDMNPRSLQVQLNEVGRGVHVLRAEVRDVGGTVLIRSQTRTFVVQQTSILNPNNPANAPIPTPLGP
jgi:hypothetical protein